MLKVKNDLIKEIVKNFCLVITNLIFLIIGLISIMVIPSSIPSDLGNANELSQLNLVGYFANSEAVEQEINNIFNLYS